MPSAFQHHNNETHPFVYSKIVSQRMTIMKKNNAPSQTLEVFFLNSKQNLSSAYQFPVVTWVVCSNNAKRDLGETRRYKGGGLQPYRGCCVIEWLPWLPLAVFNSLQLCFLQRHYWPDSSLRQRKKKIVCCYPRPNHICKNKYDTGRVKERQGGKWMWGKKLWIWQNRINVLIAMAFVCPDVPRPHPHAASEGKICL